MDGLVCQGKRGSCVFEEGKPFSKDSEMNLALTISRLVSRTVSPGKRFGAKRQQHLKCMASETLSHHE